MIIPSYFRNLIISLPLLVAFLNAQALTGKVIDSQTGDPLVGAQVFVKGTFVGTTTDVSGSYFLDVEGDVTVLVAYMGYKTQELNTSGGTANFSMEPDVLKQDEVVVTGLVSTVKRRNAANAVASVSGDDLVNAPTQTVDQALSGQFAGVNYRASKEIEIDDSQSLNIEVDGKYGLRRLPTYLTSFTDGDLSVDDAVDQVLSGGFNVEYSKSFENGFVLKPYTGLSLNQTLSEKIDIVADGERKDMAHYMDDDLAVKAGLNISKNTDDFGLNFNLEFNEQNGLKDSQVSISLTKVIQNNISKKIEGLPIDPELEKLFDQLQLAKENERLAEISGRAIEENRIMKEMIIQLIKENNKLKTERNLLLKN